MNKLDLGEYHQRFPDALRTRYGGAFQEGFGKIRDRYEEVRSRKRYLNVEDVMAIFDPGLPFAHDWTKPDREDLAGRMDAKKVAIPIRGLSDCGYDLNLITEIWICFREPSLTALVLHHVYPKLFAMCSHHLASLLYITAPTVPKFYIKYCKELKVWSERQWPTRCKLTVVDTEFALWTWYRLAHYGKEEEQKKHRNKFTNDPWVQERRAEQIASSLGTIGKLDLARHYLDADPTVAAMIAWREFETAVRRVFHNRRMKTTREDTFPSLIRRLPEDALSRNLTKGDLEKLWSRRNPVLHENEEIAEKAVAKTVLRGVVEFIEKNST